MTTEQINERIKKLEDERQELATAHDSAMQQFQQLILENRNRFQQLTGAIDELKGLIKPKGDNNEEDEPELITSSRGERHTL